MSELNNDVISKTEQVADPKVMFWNRVQLIMILLVFIAPIAGAFLYKPSGYTNYGDIYSPARPVNNLQMSGEGGDVELDSFRRQWVLIVRADGTCSTACEENLLKIRQLRFMQNNDMVRLRTVFMHTQLIPAVAEDLDAKYRPIESYKVEPTAFNKWGEILKLEDAPIEAEKDRIYIIDPAGNLMMSYPAGAEPSLINKDIKRLLKASQIG